MVTRKKPSSEVTAKDFVYAGHRVTVQGKAADCVYPIENGKLGPRMLFPAERRKRVIGGVYTGASFSDTAASGIASSEYVREWPAAEPVIEWEVRDEEAETELKGRKLERDAGAQSVIERALRPLRDMHADYVGRGNYSSANALEVAVLRALRRKP